MFLTRRVLIFAASVLVVANVRAALRVVHAGFAVIALVPESAPVARHAQRVVAHLVAWL